MEGGVQGANFELKGFQDSGGTWERGFDNKLFVIYIYFFFLFAGSSGACCDGSRAKCQLIPAPVGACGRPRDLFSYCL
jgi:hypothetical protein